MHSRIKMRRTPRLLVTLLLALLMLGALIKLGIDLARDFWVIVIATMQP